MKKLLACSWLLLVTISLFSQDTMYFSNRDVVNARVSEVTPDKVWYRLYGQEDGAILLAKTTALIQIRFENGTVMNFNPLAPADTLPLPPYSSALKTGFFSFFFDHGSLTYEHALRGNASIEAALGYIGTNTSQGHTYGLDRKMKGGVFVRLGYKYIFTGRYSRKSGDNLLHGFYFRPDLLAGYYRQQYYQEYEDPLYGIKAWNADDKVLYAAALICFGKQWVAYNRICVDIFGGMGYNFSSQPNLSNTYHKFWNFRGADFGVYSGWGSPFAITGGLRIGCMLK